MEYSRDADLISHKVDGIAAYGVEVWVPSQEVGETDSVLGGNGATAIILTPGVRLTGWRRAETGAIVDGCVKVLAVDIESIGVQHTKGRHAHGFGHGVTVITRLESVRSSTC